MSVNGGVGNKDSGGIGGGDGGIGGIGGGKELYLLLYYFFQSELCISLLVIQYSPFNPVCASPCWLHCPVCTSANHAIEYVLLYVYYIRNSGVDSLRHNYGSCIQYLFVFPLFCIFSK